VSEPAPPTLSAGVLPLALPTVEITGLSVELPPTRVSSAELAASLGIDEEWILSRTGIRERRHAQPEERLSDLSARAGARALEAAGLEASALDLVIVATITADEVTPAAAPIVARALGATRAGAFDLSAACTGFLTGLSVAAGQIESGRATHVLLIGADFLSRLTDMTDRRSAPLFADGVGAVVLSAGAPQATARRGALGSLGPVILACDGDPGRALYAEHSERLLKMDGTEVFRLAVTHMGEATVDAIAAAGLRIDDIDLFVYHQANARITRALRERLGLPAERVVDCIELIGNPSAATLPLALAHALETGALRPGMRVLLSAFGAGFTWGACVLHWGATAYSPSPTLSATSHSGAPAAHQSARV
jgi:3-oxoacyl-[acyl-carrier-protein] synthase-3